MTSTKAVVAWIMMAGWLDRSVRSQRALIMDEHGRYADALLELRIVENQLEPGSDDFAINKQFIANVLAHWGRHEEAIHEISLAMVQRERLRAETIAGLLTAYAFIAGEKGWTVPMEYQPAVEHVVEEWGMLVTPDLVRSNPTQSILLVHSQRLAAQARYVKLLEGLAGKPPDHRNHLLREFIETEPVGYFRDMAKRSLDGGEIGDGTEQGG
ncbi:MAG: hypothetical protein IT372_14390 [Polyangiaceae bacterium]|nr:hypothetical protein [Polyangiaceae bacterium]